MPNYIVQGSDLTSIANAIRTKGSTSEQLAFPTGFVSAIEAIPTGGGGMTLGWASSVTEITIGANSVTNTTEVQTYFSGYTYKMLLLKDAPTTNNQFVLALSNNSDGNMINPARYKDGAIASATIGTNYTAYLVEGSVYYMIVE